MKDKKEIKTDLNREYVKLFAEILIELSSKNEWLKIVDALNKKSVRRKNIVEKMLNRALF